MLRVTGEGAFDCEGLSRRNFVQAGLLGLGGLTLPQFLAGEARAGVGQVSPGREGTSVILMWMSGGPGHHETWDPKPTAVAQFRGPFGAIQTSVPGVFFSETLPESARLMDKLAILRSVRHFSGDHTKGNHWMLTGFEGPDFNKPDNQIQRRPSIGSAVARVRGANVTGMPAYAAAPHLRGGTDNLFHYATYLGGAANPFVVNSNPNAADYRVRDLALAGGLTFDRLRDRHSLLSTFDSVRRSAEPAVQDLDGHYQAAFDLLTNAQVRDAFDIHAEPASVRDMYGRHEFGQSTLLARRLVERGVTFVTVNTQPWDHHGTANRYATAEGANLLLPPFDRALAALVRDLEERGLYDKTLIVAMGEFGRTPRMNEAAGRDHWGHAFSVLMGGGSLPRGIVVGASDEHGAHVAERPLTPEDVAATVYHHLGIDGARTSFPDRAGRPLYLVETGEPIRELVGRGTVTG
ncbi:MAG: DUF1501 domain-containing protein [Planctomycetaceae bacterium]|nr:DUF1501 domain-containing protein [Planctomycetaceae bacterium]